MKKFIFFVLFVAVIIGSIVYFVFSSDKALVITYIKFNINPEFVIGVNSKDEVCIFNPLNEDAKILNLGMFNGNSLEDATSIILDKLEYIDEDSLRDFLAKHIRKYKSLNEQDKIVKLKQYFVMRIQINKLLNLKNVIIQNLYTKTKVLKK